MFCAVSVGSTITAPLPIAEYRSRITAATAPRPLLIESATASSTSLMTASIEVVTAGLPLHMRSRWVVVLRMGGSGGFTCDTPTIRVFAGEVMSLKTRIAVLLWRDVYRQDDIGQPIPVSTSLWTRSRSLRKVVAGIGGGSVVVAVAGAVAGAVATTVATGMLDDGKRNVLVGQKLKANFGKTPLECVVDKDGVLVCVPSANTDQNQIAGPKAGSSSVQNPDLKPAAK